MSDVGPRPPTFPPPHIPAPPPPVPPSDVGPRPPTHPPPNIPAQPPPVPPRVWVGKIPSWNNNAADDSHSGSPVGTPVTVAEKRADVAEERREVLRFVGKIAAWNNNAADASHSGDPSTPAPKLESAARKNMWDSAYDLIEAIARGDAEEEELKATTKHLKKRAKEYKQEDVKAEKAEKAEKADEDVKRCGTRRLRREWAVDTDGKMARFMAWNIKKRLAAKHGAKDTVLRELGNGWFELKLREADEREGEAKRGQDARMGWHGTTWTGLKGIVEQGKVYPGRRQDAKAQTNPWKHKTVAFTAKEKRIAIPYAEEERIGFGDINAEIKCLVRCVTGYGKTTNNTNYLQAESWAPVAVHFAVSGVKGDGSKEARWYATQEGYGKGSDRKIAATKEKARLEEEEERELGMQPQKKPTPQFGVWGHSTPLDEDVPAYRPHGPPSPDSEDSSKSCDRSHGTPFSISEDLRQRQRQRKRRSRSSRNESARTVRRRRPRGRPSSSSHCETARSPPSYSHSEV